jgi:hypothetical protein
VFESLYSVSRCDVVLEHGFYDGHAEAPKGAVWPPTLYSYSEDAVAYKMPDEFHGRRCPRLQR